MKCSNKKGWTEERQRRSFVKKTSDGHTLRVAYRKGSWHWNVRLPGGGYDLFKGSELELDVAKHKAEQALTQLFSEMGMNSIDT